MGAETLLEIRDICIASGGVLGGWSRDRARPLLGLMTDLNLTLKLANRPLLGDRALGKGEPRLVIRDRKKRLGVTLRQRARANQHRAGIIKISKAHKIRDRGTIKADSISDCLVGKTEVLRQPSQRPRTLDRVEILTLDILDQREFGRALVIQHSNQRWDRLQSNQLRRAPSALACDQFESVALRPDQDRLHQP